MEILFIAHNRLAFTKAALGALIANTAWNVVSRLVIYDDDSKDGTREYLESAKYPIESDLRLGQYGSPVQVMNDYLCARDPEHDHIFAKIDSDTMVPPCWLDESMKVMRQNPSLGLLGIEAFRPVAAGCSPSRGFQEARHIGGIGLMRSGAFVTLPRPNGRFGFTAWQEQSEKVQKGWIDPALPVFLLDRLPREPWLSLSSDYFTKGWQRRWGPYDESDKSLWSWWCD